ncbi:MAG TPA: hypothetical protein VI248_15000 [Kineosporiaceae bacterium]
MATLELVPLRSKFPYTGHMTVRFESPVIHPDVPLDLIDVEDVLDSFETTTAPQVAGAAPAGETTVRKGVQAR